MFFIEWALAVHRAIWFPVFWSLGLERPAIEVPLELGIAVSAAAPPITRKPVRIRRPKIAA
jgi:hypothetical protein